MLKLTLFRVSFFNRLLLLVLVNIVSYISYSQVVISYPSPAENITSNYSSSKLKVKISFANTCDPVNKDTLRIKFPQGVKYVPGSLSYLGSPTTLGLSEYNITDLRKPVFTFTNTGYDITFTVNRKAGCTVGATFKDSIEIFGSSCANTDYTISINNYNINEAALTLTPPSPISNAIIGTTSTRSIKVTNGGNGAIDTVYFYIIYPTGALQNTNGNKITVSGVDFSPTISGDTLFYKLFGATVFGGDNKLDPTEFITISEPIKVLTCNATTTKYNVGWGESKAKLCQNYNTTGTITMANGVADFATAPSHVDVGFVNYCTPWKQKANFKNSGTGTASAGTMYNVKIKFGTYSAVSNWGVGGMNFIYSNFKVGTGSIAAIGNNATTYLMDFENKLNFDPDGVGGLEDLDGDGFYDDLAPGATLNLEWDVVMDCGTTCGRTTTQRIGSIMTYQDMCGNPITSPIRILAPYKYAESGFSSAAYFPVNVVNGGIYRFDFNTTFGGNTNTYFGANGRYEYRLVLPPGFSVAPTPNAKYGAAAIAYTLSGDTVIIRSTNNTFQASAGIDLIYHCGVDGPVSFYHSLRKIQDYTSSCKCAAEQLFCRTITSYAHCPVACADGPTNYQPVVRRTNGCLGWTDHTLATRQNASAISAYDLSKALYLDTIQITGSAKQNNNASNLHLRFELPKTGNTAGGIKKLAPINALIEIWRGGVKVHNCTLTAFTDLSATQVNQIIDWNICLPSGGLLAGDSIYSISRYVVATNAGLPQDDVQSGDSWYFYNDNAGTKEYCNTWTPEMYLVGTNIIIGTNGTNATGCSSFVPGSGFAYIARRFNSNGKDFQSEFRPMAYIDSIVFTKTDGYDLISADLMKNAGPKGTPAITIPLIPNYVSGNKYTYTNPGTWPFFGITVTNFYGGNFRPTVSTNCKTTATETFVTKIYIKDYYYAFGNPAKVPAAYQYIMSNSSSANVASTTQWNYNLNYVESTRPDISVQNMTGTVQTTSTGTHSWDVKLSNNSTGNSSYVWLALEKGTGAGTINITSVQDVTHGTTLTSVGSYSCSGRTGYRWYKFSAAGLAPGTSNTFRINFTQSGCVNDSILLRSGWNCSGYPSATPCDYPCTTKDTYLKVIPEPAEIQMSITHQANGGAKMDLCVEDYITLVVNSAQAADLIDPYLTFYPPTGVTVNTANIKVEYPLGSGNIQSPAISSLGGGGFKIDLNGHTGIAGKGILGVVNALDPNETKASVKIPFTLDCDFLSGKTVSFNGFGKKPCGNPAIGNGKTISSTSIKVNGVSESGGATMNFITAGPISFECDKITTLEHTSTTYGEKSVSGDTLTYTLPSGISYNGSFSSSPSSTALVSGNVVKVPVPVGTTTINVQFDIQSHCNNCNSNSVHASYQRDVVGLVCGLITCPSSKSELAATNIGVDCYDPLPITLLDFSAKNKECNIIINWSTGTERNNDYFEIYRSDDGLSWNVITSVAGHGNSSTKQDYQYIDSDVDLNKTYYYYLKQVDFDGKSEAFAPVSAIHQCETNEIKVYPNPTKGQLIIEITADEHISIVDVIGHTISNYRLNSGKNTIHVGYLAAGVYFIKTSDGRMVKFVKE